MKRLLQSLIFLLIVNSLLIIPSVCFIKVYQDQQFDQTTSQITQLLKRINHSYMAEIADALFVGNTLAYQETLKDIVSTDGIIGAAIFLTPTTLLSKYPNSQPADFVPPGTYKTNDQIVLNEPIEALGRTFGYLQITFQIIPREKAFSTFSLLIIINMVISFILFGIFQRLRFTTPLQEILSKVASTSVFSPSVYSHDIIQQVHSELNSLVQNYNEISVNHQVLSERLEDAEKKLMVMKATEERIMGMYSHELKNYSQSIALVFSHFSENYLPTEFQEYLDKGKITFERLQNLLMYTSMWARLQNEALALNLSTVDLPLFVQTILLKFKDKCAKKSLIIDTQHLETGFFTIDQELFGLVLMALIDNAIKYSHEGQTITLATQFSDTHVCISIADQGVGIPEAIQHKIFKPQFKINHSGTHQEKGPGIGLILTSRIMEFHQGNITFSSTEGQGSCFTLTLPR